MSTAIPSQHPAVVLRSQYNHLRTLSLVAGAKAGDRGVIGRLARADHPECHVLATTPLDPPRRPNTDRITGLAAITGVYRL